MIKIQSLIDAFAKKESVLVAFSGGVDSSAVALLAFRALGNRAMAVTIDSEVIAGWELRDACTVASLIGIRHHIVSITVLEDDGFARNPAERCYLCKKKIISELKSLARRQGMRVIADGTNADDTGDFRPGMRAWREEGLWSPLLECGVGKEESREIVRDAGLPIWDKPSAACLASRIPYGTRITLAALERIEASEAFLHSLGFRQVRVRDHGETARIEVDDVERATSLRSDIVGELKKYYRYVSIDLEGYRTGSLNVVP